jgi:hypothetical protein
LRERIPAPVERILHGIEDRIEHWREQEIARKAEVEAARERLWEEAAERERLLAEALDRRAGSTPGGEVAGQHRIVFVVHSDRISERLEELVRDGARLTGALPARDNYARDAGVRGTWLVFD